MKKWLRQLRELLRFKGDFNDFYISADGAQVSLPTGMPESDKLLTPAHIGFDGQAP
jgi:hypothetical protein